MLWGQARAGYGRAAGKSKWVTCVLRAATRRFGIGIRGRRAIQWPVRRQTCGSGRQLAYCFCLLGKRAQRFATRPSTLVRFSTRLQIGGGGELSHPITACPHSHRCGSPCARLFHYARELVCWVCATVWIQLFFWAEHRSRTKSLRGRSCSWRTTEQRRPRPNWPLPDHPLSPRLQSVVSSGPCKNQKYGYCLRSASLSGARTETGMLSPCIRHRAASSAPVSSDFYLIFIFCDPRLILDRAIGANRPAGVGGPLQ
jgi:hypothetical protein